MESSEELNNLKAPFRECNECGCFSSETNSRIFPLQTLLVFFPSDHTARSIFAWVQIPTFAELKDSTAARKSSRFPWKPDTKPTRNFCKP